MASDYEAVSANINLVSLVNVPLYTIPSVASCISVASQLPCMVRVIQGGGQGKLPP